MGSSYLALYQANVVRERYCVAIRQKYG